MNAFLTLHPLSLLSLHFLLPTKDDVPRVNSSQYGDGASSMTRAYPESVGAARWCLVEDRIGYLRHIISVLEDVKR